ncbi:MAG: hypothetical protein ACF8QF_10925 [Phycisphaerales bacterium]
MSRFNDPRHLETQLARAHEGGLVLDRDRACKKCSYDLSGLRYGARCPECGTVIRYGRSMIVPVRDRMQDAPVWYIRLVEAGFVSMAAGSLGVIAIALAVAGRLPWLLENGGAITAMLVLAGAWLSGVGVLCAPKPSTERVERTAHDDLWWKVGAGASQSLWFAAPLLAMAPDSSIAIAGRPLDLLAAWGCVALALCGLLPVAWLGAGFHEWMQDDDGAGKSRRRACWFIGVAAFLLLGGTLRVPLGIPIVSVLLGGFDFLPVIAAWLALTLLWSLVALARMASWSVTLKRTDEARTERLRVRRDAETAAEHDRLANAPIEPPPTYAKAPVPKSQSGHAGPDRVAGSEWRR